MITKFDIGQKVNVKFFEHEGQWQGKIIYILIEKCFDEIQILYKIEIPDTLLDDTDFAGVRDDNTVLVNEVDCF